MGGAEGRRVRRNPVRPRAVRSPARNAARRRRSWDSSGRCGRCSRPRPRRSCGNWGRGIFRWRGPRRGGARCAGGAGTVTTPMQFLPDLVTVCPECGGDRFKPEVLAVRVRGASIAGVLDLTADEAVPFFRGPAEAAGAGGGGAGRGAGPPGDRPADAHALGRRGPAAAAGEGAGGPHDRRHANFAGGPRRRPAPRRRRPPRRRLPPAVRERARGGGERLAPRGCSPRPTRWSRRPNQPRARASGSRCRTCGTTHSARSRPRPVSRRSLAERLPQIRRRLRQLDQRP